ncbi:Outer dense fiber protein 3 [Echinococcus granulosus]|nr:Outer dense fiber protein 3 [Echinococcus granulosus]
MFDGGEKRRVEAINAEEPAFIKRFRERSGMRPEATIESKRVQPRCGGDDDEDWRDREDEAPQVVAGIGVSESEAIDFAQRNLVKKQPQTKKSGAENNNKPTAEEIEAERSGRVLFRKPKAKEDSKDMREKRDRSGRKGENEGVKKTEMVKRNKKSGGSLSFSYDDEEEGMLDCPFWRSVHDYSLSTPPSAVRRRRERSPLGEYPKMGEEKLGYPYTRPRVPIYATYGSPGPVYKLPPLLGEKDHDFESIHIKAPAYSFGHQYKNLYYEASPGPAAYPQNGKMTNHGLMQGPAYSLKQRLDPDSSSPGPGPAQYLPNDNAVHPRSPGYQFGLAAPDLLKNPGPAPNAYSLPRPDIISGKTSAPQYTLTGRNDGLSTPKNPGPADYTIGNPEITKPSAPKFSMGATLPIPLKPMPGPADYRVDDVTLTRRRAPKFSMGIYHSPYKLDIIDKGKDDWLEC